MSFVKILSYVYLSICVSCGLYLFAYAATAGTSLTPLKGLIVIVVFCLLVGCLVGLISLAFKAIDCIKES